MEKNNFKDIGTDHDIYLQAVRKIEDIIAIKNIQLLKVNLERIDEIIFSFLEESHKDSKSHRVSLYKLEKQFERDKKNVSFLGILTSGFFDKKNYHKKLHTEKLLFEKTKSHFLVSNKKKEHELALNDMRDSFEEEVSLMALIKNEDFKQAYLNLKQLNSDPFYLNEIESLQNLVAVGSGILKKINIVFDKISEADLYALPINSMSSGYFTGDIDSTSELMIKLINPNIEEIVYSLESYSTLEKELRSLSRDDLTVDRFTHFSSRNLLELKGIMSTINANFERVNLRVTDALNSIQSEWQNKKEPFIKIVSIKRDQLVNEHLTDH